MQKKKNVLGFVLQNWKFMTRVEHIEITQSNENN